MTTNGMRIVDADGHVLEPPDGMLQHAPAKFRDRIWHIEVARRRQRVAALQRRLAARRRPGARRHGRA